jgi:hypothetical protein
VHRDAENKVISQPLADGYHDDLVAKKCAILKALNQLFTCRVWVYQNKTMLRHTGVLIEWDGIIRAYDFGYKSFLANLTAGSRGGSVDRKYHCIGITHVYFKEEFLEHKAILVDNICVKGFFNPFDLALEYSTYRLVGNNCRHFCIRVLDRILQYDPELPSDTQLHLKQVRKSLDAITMRQTMALLPNTTSDDVEVSSATERPSNQTPAISTGYHPEALPIRVVTPDGVTPTLEARIEEAILCLDMAGKTYASYKVVTLVRKKSVCSVRTVATNCFLTHSLCC